MNRDQIIGLVLIFLIIFGASWWMQPSQEEREAMQHRADSIALVQEEKAQRELEAQVKRDSVRQANQGKVEQGGQNQEINETQLQARYGEFSSAAVGEEKALIVETDLMKLDLLNKGGRISQVELKDYQTYDSLPLILMSKETSEFALSFYYGTRVIRSTDFYFQPYLNGQLYTGDENIRISGDDVATLGLRLYLDTTAAYPEERYIEFEYMLSGNSYYLDYNINFHNVEQLIAHNNNSLNLDWSNKIQGLEKSIEDERKVTSIFFKHYQDAVESLSETKDHDDESVMTRMKWVGFKQKFFTTVLVAENYFEGAEMEMLTDEKEFDNPKYVKSLEAGIEIPFDGMDSKTIPMHFYFGPTKYKILNSFDQSFEEMIPLGWWLFRIINRYAVILVFNWLETTGLNYGIIILVLTILLKMVLLPIAYKTYVSSAKMRVLKPEIDEINKKYPKQEDAMKKQQATMSLYKKAGVNPLAGCVPMLLQMPILIAMFRFFPASIELRQQSFLWAEDLSTYDSVLQLPWDIPFYGDHVSLFTLLMTISTIIYTKVNSELMGTNNQQMPGMKTMMYLMPLMFLGFLNNYASGLSYYYLLANLITFAQMFIIRSTVNDDKLRAKIQENKKKPVKKSKFAQRLEDAQKMQQQQAKGKRK